MSLPVLIDQAAGSLEVIDPDTGESLPVSESSDRALIHAARAIADLEAELWIAKRAIAGQVRQRHGVGVTQAGGFRFTVAESTSWPMKATSDALARLVVDGRISQGDFDRCLPAKPKADARQLKALAGRLATSDPEAAKVLADACTVSPPSLRDVHADAVEADPC